MNNTTLNSNFTYNSAQPQANDNQTTIINYLYGVEFIIGTILNTLTLIVVCARKSLRNASSFVFVGFIAAANLIIMFTNAMPKFVQELASSDWNSSNLPWCKVSLFFQIFSFNWSAWLLVSILVKTYMISIHSFCK